MSILHGRLSHYSDSEMIKRAHLLPITIVLKIANSAVLQVQLRRQRQEMPASNKRQRRNGGQYADTNILHSVTCFELVKNDGRLLVLLF